MNKNQTKGNDNPTVIIPFLQGLLGYHNVKQSETNPDTVEITGFSAIELESGQPPNLAALAYQLNDFSDVNPPQFNYVGIDSNGEKTNDERIIASLSALQRNVGQVFNLDAEQMKDAYNTYLLVLAAQARKDNGNPEYVGHSRLFLEQLTGLGWESSGHGPVHHFATEAEAESALPKLVGLDPRYSNNSITLGAISNVLDYETRKQIADNFGKSSLIKPPLNNPSTKKRDRLEHCTGYVWEDVPENNAFIAQAKSLKDANSLAIGLRLESAEIAEANGLKAGFSVQVNEETNTVSVNKDTLEALSYMYRDHVSEVEKHKRAVAKAKQNNDKGLG